MSGIVGIINRGGKPVDAELLRHMTDTMAFRGPDAQETWIDGAVGFGHAMLRTTFEAEKERQPCTLDGQVWITADVRIDARQELISRLTAKGCTHLEALTDPELILRAYTVWGRKCVDYLLGDFAFAIWDGRERRLFCARDHFGVKPFYYAEIPGSILFSNTLNCLRTHPEVSDGLNDLAIADFLMFGFSISMDNSAFEDIKRLPPAHTLTWTPERRFCMIESYWSLSAPQIVRFRRRSEYAEHFREVLTSSIEDRLRTNRAAISMSGGLDSTSIALIAHQQLSKRHEPFTLVACTNITERTPDLEKPYARHVAEHLNIPIVFNTIDGGDPNPYHNKEAGWTPEPTGLSVFQYGAFDQVIDKRSIRVMFTGFGGDPALYPSQLGPYGMVERGYGAWNLLADHIHFITLRHRVAPLYLRSGRHIDQATGHRWHPPFPPWLLSTLINDLNLDARWQDTLNRTLYPHTVANTLRPRAFVDLTGPLWPNIFTMADPETTRRPVETTFPFFDIRLIYLILGLPPIPWCVDKEILRAAMVGIMPEMVRTRPKTPLQGDPTRSALSTMTIDEAQVYITQAPKIERFVDIAKYLKLFANSHRLKDNEFELLSRPLGLAYWLTNFLNKSR